MEAKAMKVYKQAYFWFDDKSGFMVYQLGKPADGRGLGGLYLINVGDKDQIFSFSGLQKEAELISENEIRIYISLPTEKGGPPFNIISKYKFDQIISLFKEMFGEK
ncbi:hypothetical protein K9M48_00760 [Candidatus Gracilibacteria bacterium]|nr:hypothetical protein [Candidatus Gracilibacteria bacterium]